MKATTDDLLDALRQALTKPEFGEGMTGPEIAEALAISKGTMLKCLHRLNREGRLEVVTVQRTRINGVPAPTTGYRIKS